MPGTILVSVLEFMGLPLSSTSIKVSMGKTESLISEEGDFSFPLASLREDLIIKLQDSDGNEISRIGFHTKSIVEKGVWEDIFALGHGHLRLKLQFILNDEDRDRIRMMRQSALKKKHDELLSSSPRGSESDSASVGNAALAFRNDENGAYIGTGAEASKNAKIDETEESKSKSSDGNGDEISGRPIKQAIKVAIIIGFGIFVLLTRQRKGR
ncbi:uncharacterized protein LOC114731208 isoform X2 [Neltuma alba]|uniref:uncharacterized protein LOC114731208 isoform X2 n=1 Tax=Neltuma alba TaxID=207710 RepID=UPI0010A419F3|nr:uncharacterized protein LOC114731208 isoform X2 [Prosopis alba]